MTDNNTALKKAGLKVTLPRLKILEVLQEPDNHHVSAEDLYKRGGFWRYPVDPPRFSGFVH